ncbi:MAG: hypothetical protein U0869_05810 [Chloroflexota bacterium]
MIPRRGAAAVLVTVGGLALLFSFRAPEAGGLTLGLDGGDGGTDGGLGADNGGLGGDDGGLTAALPSDGSAGLGPDASLAPESSVAPDPTDPPTPEPVLGPPAPGRGDAPAASVEPAGPPAPKRTARPKPDPTPEPAAPTDPPAQKVRTATGNVMRTPYGDIQVAVTVKGQKITDVQAVAMPDGDRHSRRIAQIVEPMLHDDVIQLQTWRIHIVSGATYDSVGYARSLQSALDKLGIDI